MQQALLCCYLYSCTVDKQDCHCTTQKKFALWIIACCVAEQVAVAPGFTPGAEPFSANLTGSGDLFLLNLTATPLTLNNNGCAHSTSVVCMSAP